MDMHPLLPPVAPTLIDPALVITAAETTSRRRPSADLTVRVNQSADPDPIIVVTEHERETTIDLDRLVDRLERRHTPANQAAIDNAFDEWLDQRPVTDVDAVAKGIATLAWSQQQSRISWTVVVPRPSGLTPQWVPTVHTTPEHVHHTREAALARAQDLTVTGLPLGDVTVWVYLINPALSTAVLAQPDVLTEGRDLDDLYAVFTPGRPVAVAAFHAARRLTEESTELHQMLPLADLHTIGWM